MNNIYRAKYSNSRAIIIGIDHYKHINDLSYACNDAIGIKKILIEKFDFEEENITLLLNEDATKSKIMFEFYQFKNDFVEVDDRIILFYAGHGYTFEGQRGDIGVLVPHDGDIKDFSSLIRWDDLTRGSDLIRAKHILFIMDACYSGLAITRSLSTGSTRFLKDMLRRSSRQVITAGKANEVVADSNGPIPGHSIFTGHLLQGLEGNAANLDGIITANNLMAYVYDKVSKDQYSQQTPHYGFILGDGDFIFKAPILDTEIASENIEIDYFVEVNSLVMSENEDINRSINQAKEYLSNPYSIIKLDELINKELKLVMSELKNYNKFAEVNHGNIQGSFSKTIELYEEKIGKLSILMSCIAYWGKKEHYYLLSKVILRLAESIEDTNSLDLWNKIKWYPIMYLIYSAGISAIVNDNYFALNKLFSTRVKDKYSRNSIRVLKAIIDNITDIQQNFKYISGNENHYVPRSEYLYKRIQPHLDDQFYLGKSYEDYFDKFEIFYGLAYAYEYSKKHSDIWGPVGRFGWKYKNDRSVYRDIIDESITFKEKWDPLTDGLFDGDYKVFEKISEEFEKVIINTRFF